MQEKDVLCDSCPHKSCKLVKTRQPQKGAIDIVVVGSAPLENDFQYGAFSSQSSEMVKNAFSKHFKFGTARVAFTYVVHCVVPKVTAEVVQKCVPHTLMYLERMRPKVILLMGNDALRVLGLHESVSKVRGSLLSYTYDDGSKAVVIPTYHPATIYKAPGLTSVLLKDVNKAIKYATNKAEEEPITVKVLTNYKDIIDELDGIKKFLDEAPSRKTIAVDTETTSVKPYAPGERLIAISISPCKYTGISFPLEHRDAGFSPVQISKIIERLGRILGHPKASITMHNAKFDYQWLSLRYGIPMSIGMDTMLAEHALEEDKKGSYSLKEVTKDRYPYLGGYEDALRQELQKATESIVERHDLVVEGKLAAFTQQAVSWWMELGPDERNRLLALWVDAGYITVKDTAGLADMKMRKSKGEMVIPKKHMTGLNRVLGKVPVEVLAEHAPGLAEAYAAYIAEKSKKVDATFEDIPMDTMLHYAAMDALVTLIIFSEQLDDIKKDSLTCEAIGRKDEGPLQTQSIMHAVSAISVPLCSVLAEMEYKGITVDRARIKEYMNTITDKKTELLDSMYSEVGYKFNTSSSSPELAKVIFDEMGFESLKETESGARSTDAETLKNLAEANDSQFLRNLMAYRKLDKCLSTYLVNWYKLSADDGKIHCSYNQIGTATFRLSSSNPNLGQCVWRL